MVLACGSEFYPYWCIFQRYKVQNLLIVVLVLVLGPFLGFYVPRLELSEFGEIQSKSLVFLSVLGCLDS